MVGEFPWPDANCGSTLLLEGSLFVFGEWALALIEVTVIEAGPLTPPDAAATFPEFYLLCRG